MKEYSNQTIFIGIDVHKKSYSISAIHNGTLIKKATIVADPDILLSFLYKNFNNAQLETAYEAGFSGFYLHRYLVGNGINNIVVHPASIEIASRERVKNDRRDSLKIATQLSAGRLKSVYIPNCAREDFRTISRLRNSFVKDRTKKGVQLKCVLHRLGKIPYSETTFTSKKWIEKVLKMDFSPDQKFVIEHLTNEWLHLTTKIKEIEIKLIEQSKIDNSLEKIYLSIPGFGPTISRVLANELEDMKQFSNERQVFSYTGLTPREYSSGEHIRLGHISRQGKPVLRKMLIQAAWIAIKIDKELEEIYLRISRKAGKKRAIVAVARILIGRTRTCLKENRPYR
jgi:transposase